MYSPIDTQSHAGSSSSLHWQAATMNHVSHNHMTLTFWLRCIKYINNQYICTKFGAHSSSCFLFRVWKHRWTQTHRVNWSSYPATTGVGNKHSTILCSPTGQPTSSVEGASQTHWSRPQKITHQLHHFLINQRFLKDMPILQSHYQVH